MQMLTTGDSYFTASVCPFKQSANPCQEHSKMHTFELYRCRSKPAKAAKSAKAAQKSKPKKRKQQASNNDGNSGDGQDSNADQESEDAGDY